jgi:recombination protein RecR
MSLYPKNIQNLIEEFSLFPSIGPKTAERFVIYLLKKSPQDLENLANLIKSLKNLKKCKICNSFSENEICQICSDPNRDQNTICVVAEQKDLIAIENTHEYKGLYHILEGVLNPIQNITPEKLKIKELLKKIDGGKIKEVILALNPDLDGETTSLYLIDLLKKYPLKITRLARGLPIGGSLEYIDEITLSNALKRREIIKNI